MPTESLGAPEEWPTIVSPHPVSRSIEADFCSIVILEALIRAYEDDVDVLTMSFGASAGWTEGTSSVVASRIAASGKIVTIAAGNWVRL